LQLIIIVLASLIPGVLWVWYFRLKDKFEREPISHLIRAFLLGALMVGLAALLELPFKNWVLPDAPRLLQIAAAFGVIGLGEELLKALAVYLAVFNSSELDEPIDGIIYSAAAGIGFSVVENVLYSLTFGLSVAPARALIASLAHACFSGIFGVFFGRAKFSNKPVIELSRGLFYAALMHGLYDFILISQILSPLAAVALIVILYFILQHNIKRALRDSPFS
jgi:RsiW-degrading membrane proteinase PrsW (M82 family)